MTSSARNHPDPRERLRQTLLHRPDLDLAARDQHDNVAAYGPCRHDPVTATISWNRCGGRPSATRTGSSRADRQCRPARRRRGRTDQDRLRPRRSGIRSSVPRCWVRTPPILRRTRRPDDLTAVCRGPCQMSSSRIVIRRASLRRFRSRGSLLTMMSLRAAAPTTTAASTTSNVPAVPHTAPADRARGSSNGSMRHPDNTRNI